MYYEKTSEIKAEETTVNTDMEGTNMLHQNFVFPGLADRRSIPEIHSYVNTTNFMSIEGIIRQRRMGTYTGIKNIVGTDGTIRQRPQSTDGGLDRSSPASIQMKIEKEGEEVQPEVLKHETEATNATQKQISDPSEIKTEPEETSDVQDEPMDLSMAENRKEKEVPQKDSLEISTLTNEVSNLAFRRPNLSSISMPTHFNPIHTDQQPDILQDKRGYRQGTESDLEDHGFSRMNQVQPSPSPYNRFSRSGSTSSRPGHRSIHLCNDSYVAIIGEIILQSPKKMVLLRDIYEEIEKNGVIARSLPRSWKSIIRHRLTVNECFIKCSEQISSYRHFWAIHPNYVEQFSRRIFTSARNYRSSSLSLIQTGSNDNMDMSPDKIMKSSSIGGMDIAMKRKVQLKIPKIK